MQRERGDIGCTAAVLYCLYFCCTGEHTKDLRQARMATPQEYMWEWDCARSEVAFPRLPRSHKQDKDKPPPTTAFYRDAEGVC